MSIFSFSTRLSSPDNASSFATLISVVEDFFTVLFGFISLKIFGDKKYDNWINKLGFNLDVFFSKITMLHSLFARVIIYGSKK